MGVYHDDITITPRYLKSYKKQITKLGKVFFVRDDIFVVIVQIVVIRKEKVALVSIVDSYITFLGINP